MTLNELAGYPCTIESELKKGDLFLGCTRDCETTELCPILPIYRKHIALREAVLGDMTAAEAAKMYRTAARAVDEQGSWRRARRLYALADEVEKL